MTERMANDRRISTTTINHHQQQHDLKALDAKCERLGDDNEQGSYSALMPTSSGDATLSIRPFDGLARKPRLCASAPRAYNNSISDTHNLSTQH